MYLRRHDGEEALRALQHCKALYIARYDEHVSAGTMPSERLLGSLARVRIHTAHAAYLAASEQLSHAERKPLLGQLQKDMVSAIQTLPPPPATHAADGDDGEKAGDADADELMAERGNDGGHATAEAAAPRSSKRRRVALVPATPGGGSGDPSPSMAAQMRPAAEMWNSLALLHLSEGGVPAARAVLRRLVSVVAPETVAPRVAGLVTELCRALTGTSGLAAASPTLRIEALLAISAIARWCGPACLVTVAPATVRAVLDAADDRYYKVTSESLRLCQVLVDAFGPSPVRAGLSPVVARIYEAAVSRLSGREQDSEVKSASLRVVAAVFAMYGAELDAKSRADAPRLLLARLNNEVTRTPGVLALSRCCGSPVAVDADVQAEFASVLGGFLRKTDRAAMCARTVPA